MERNRDRDRDNSRRGMVSLAASIPASASASASSRRKPRSGSGGVFKDSIEDEDGLNESHDSSRLRERSGKKERSALQSRNKRKRPSHFERFSRERGRDHDAPGVESSDESAGAGVGPVDEDEDYEEPVPHPSRPPAPSSQQQRKPTKLRSPWKGTDELILAGTHITVPRKARSAPKRSQDSASGVAAAGATGTATAYHQNHHQNNSQYRQKSPPPATVPASPSSSNASVKQQQSSKRMKPMGSRPRPSKVARVSSSISERELEVAEALYGLTRQFHDRHNHQPPPSEGYANSSHASTSKCEPKDEASAVVAPAASTCAPAAGTAISKVLSSSSVVSSSLSPPPSSSSTLQQHHQHSTLTSAPAMAPKRKRPRPAKPEEALGTVAMKPPTPAIAAAAVKNDAEHGSLITKVEASSPKSETQTNTNASVVAAGARAVSSSASFVNRGLPTNLPVASAMSVSNSSPLRSNQCEVSAVGQRPHAAKALDRKPTLSDMASESGLPDLKGADEKIAESKVPSTQNHELQEVKIEDAKSAADTAAITESTKFGELATDVKSSQQPLVAEDFDKVVSAASGAAASDMPSTDLPSAPDSNEESSKMCLRSIKTENPPEGKFEIDLMAPPARSPADLEDESGGAAHVAVVDRSEVKQTTEKDAAANFAKSAEITAKAVKEEPAEPAAEPERKEVLLQEEEAVVQKRNVRVELDIDTEAKGGDVHDKSCEPTLQKQSRLTGNETVRGSPQPQQQNNETVAVQQMNSMTTCMAMPVTVANWPGGLHSLSYFGAAAGTWAGAPPLQVVAMERSNRPPVLQQPAAYMMAKPQKAWKRCATHSYIAHFIAYQQQMARHHPFWAASNYANSLAVYGGKPYNLNLPMAPPPSEILNLGADKTVDPVQERSNVTSLPPFNEKSLGSENKQQNANVNSTAAAAAAAMPANMIQQGLPGLRFLTAQTGAAAIQGTSAVPKSAGAGAAVAANGTANGAGLSAAAAMGAEYLAMFQNMHPFAHGHFGAATYSGAGQQAAASQFFSSPFYAAQMMSTQMQAPPPPPSQQQQQQAGQNPTTSSGSSSSQKQHQPQIAGAPRQQKQQKITSSASGPNSQQQHMAAASQSRQTERDNGADSLSTADSRVAAAALKPFFCQTSSANPSLFPAAVPFQSQDYAFMAALGGAKHKQQQPTTAALSSSSQMPQHQVVPGYSFQGNDSGAAFQMNFGHSPAQAMAALSRSPGGIIGFPGHAALQDPMQRMGQMQKASTAEESSKSTVKSGLSSSLNFSKMDSNETSANRQASPSASPSPADATAPSGSSCAPISVDNVGRALNIINTSRAPLANGSQILKQQQQAPPAVSRAKNMPTSNPGPPAADRTGTSATNLKYQPAQTFFPGQAMKNSPLVHQSSSNSQWKVSPPPNSCSSPPQSVYSSKNFPQQSRNHHQSNNPNLLVGPVVAAQPMHQHNSCIARLSSSNAAAASGTQSLPSSSQASVSKSAAVSNSILRTPPGSKAAAMSQHSQAQVQAQNHNQKNNVNAAVASGPSKKSSPVSGRSSPSVLSPTHISQGSSSGKPPQQQQSQPTSAQSATGLKGQQPYHSQSQSQYNQQQLFSPNQYIQQQMAHQLSVPMQGNGYSYKQAHSSSNSTSASFATCISSSSSSSNPGALSLGLGASPKSNVVVVAPAAASSNKAATVSYAPYGGPQQSGPVNVNVHAALASQFMQVSQKPAAGKHP